MKVSRRDLSIIMVIVGIAAAFVVYQFYFTGAMTTRETLVSETKSLQSEFDALMVVADSQQNYETTIRSNTEKLDTLVSKFPAQYKYEDGIMYLYGLEHNESYGVYFGSYTVSETAITSSQKGMVNGAEKVYGFGNSMIAASYLCKDYESIKTLINDIYNDAYPKSIESIQMSFSPTTGEISGSMNLNMYSLTDGTNKYVPLTIPEVDMKVDCIFGEVIPVIPEEGTDTDTVTE